MAMAPLSPDGRLSSQQQPSLPAPSQGLIQQQKQSLGTSLPPQASGNYRSSVELRSLDCNLAALCDHIQVEGFNSGIFSDVVVQAMGATYRLHRLILSRSSYFRNMLHGPWKEAGLPTLVLYIDDANVNSEAIEVALAYLYGHQPKLNDNNAFRVLAAASFLDLQDLCAVCTDFIISELWTSNFLSYQVFAESQDYGIHGERVRNACWGYLCQSATTELREVLPKLSPQILHSLLTSDELWVPNEEKRFELALHALLVKASMSELEHAGEESFSSDKISTSDTPRVRGESSSDAKSGKQQVESELSNLSVEDNFDRSKAVPDAFLEHSDHVAGPDRDLFYMNSLQGATTHQVQDARYSLNRAQAVSSNSLVNTNAITTSCSYIELQNDVETRLRRNEVAAEGPSGESHCHQLNNRIWLSQDQSKMSSASLSTNIAVPSDWGRCNMPSWGGRIVGRGHVKGAKSDSIIHDEHYDAFVNIFEGGSLLYCNMSFEALLNVRRQLEELDFPCKAVNDGLWLQMLLCHRVQAIVADSCKNCCLRNNACQCSQTFRYSHGNIPAAYYRQEHDRNSTNTMGGIYIADAQGDGSGLFGPVRVHVRGAIDGLVSIGRGTTYVPGDGLTALVGLSQGNNVVDVHTEEVETVYGTSPQHRFPGVVHLDASDISVQMLEVQENSSANEWENSEGSSISLDLQTPLRQFPPFRFGVEFKHVDKLTDGQVRHSTEVFYAGSLWKVSVQAFSDEDPQGRRTLGLFLHRRKAEVTDSLRKLHMYVDTREKVTARYQLICPSKREVLVFGSFKQAGTLLPKAPKGWGWRTALLFDELADLLQVGALRVTAVVQLV